MSRGAGQTNSLESGMPGGRAQSATEHCQLSSAFEQERLGKEVVGQSGSKAVSQDGEGR